MTGLTILDIFISLIFLFLLYSLLATTIVETIASSLGLRARNLSTGIKRMLNDDKPIEDAPSKFKALLTSARQAFTGFNNKSEGLHKIFYQQPAIKYMGKNNFQSKPSYISPKAFSETLVDMLGSGSNASIIDNINNNLGKSSYDDLEEIKATHNFILNEIQGISEVIQNDQIENTGFSYKQLLLESQRKADIWHVTQYWKSEKGLLPIEPETQQFLNRLWSKANQDIEKFQFSIHGWYQEYTERISGWYKRKISLLLFLTGLLLAIFFKIDTIKIAKNLADNEQMRTAVMTSVDAFYKTNEGSKFEDIPFETIKKELSNYNSFLVSPDKESENSNSSFSDIIQSGLTTFLGYLITAFAISLGGPFWFDLLNKLMKMRTSIKPKDQGPTENTQATFNQPNAVG